MRVPTHLAGVSAPCPKCGAKITAPSDISEAFEEEASPRRSANSPSHRTRPSVTGNQISVGSAKSPGIATSTLAAPASRTARPTPPASGYADSSYADSVPVSRPPESRPVPPPSFVVPEPVPAEEPDQYHEDDTVVVEVTNYAAESPPPLTPITQPIQVNSRPTIFPEVRDEVPETNSLPRLDVSLAGDDLSEAAALLFPTGGSQSVRTVVKLPQPGSDPSLHSPEIASFIISPKPESEWNDEELVMLDEAPKAVKAPDEDLVDEETRETVPSEEWEPISLDDLALPEENENLAKEPEENFFYEDPAIEDGLSASEEDFQITGPIQSLPVRADLNVIDWNEELPLQAEQTDADSELPWITSSDETAPVETSRRTLSTTWQSLNTQPIPTLAGNSTPVSDEIPVQEEYVPAVESLHEGSVGKLFSPEARHSHSADYPGSPDEGDVLDELFGSTQNTSKGLSKTAVVMLCGIAAAAIIATVVVIFIINLMGGLDPRKAYEENPAITASNPIEPAPVETEIPAEPSINDAPAVIDPTAMIRVDPAAAEVSIDERIQRVVNSAEGTPIDPVLETSPRFDVVENAIDQFKSETAGGQPAATPPLIEEAPPIVPAESPEETNKPSDDSNKTPAAAYNPPAKFPAPGPGESPLLNTNELIDAFIKAPDWQTRVKYVYQGESLRAAMEDYYQKWPDEKIEKFSLQLFQMEQDVSLGGPYWVYLVSTSDTDYGFPIIVRTEDGNLKLDWEIYSEFRDRHFVRFREGYLSRPSTFRVVIERVSDYFGTDRANFKDLATYNVYQVKPPYGEPDEFSEYAFVKKDSPLAKKLDAVVGLNDEPLAVMVTIDEKLLDHGTKHFVITDYLTEGWFR